MDIRKATEDDFIEILYITKGFQGLVPTASNLNWSFGEPTEKQLIEAIAQNNVYVVSENLILGVLQLQKSKSTNNEDVILIHNFAIHPIGDRKNLGIFILEFAIGEAKNQQATTLSIHVSKNHSRCIEILNILGFTNRSTENQEALLFNKKL
jgi:N-acetylglutamate synthase-like GNAT family acetyltransferase